MSAWNPVSEKERAAATVTRRGLELRLAQDEARRLGDMLRRATRAIAEAEAALGVATHWLNQTETAHRASSHWPTSRPVLTLLAADATGTV